MLIQAPNYREYEIALLEWSLELIVQPFRRRTPWLNWGKFEDRRRLHKVILMYKCVHEETEGLNVNLISHMDRHQHNTRRKEDFIHPKPATEQMKDWTT